MTGNIWNRYCRELLKWPPVRESILLLAFILSGPTFMAQQVFDAPHSQFKVDNMGQLYTLSDNGIDLYRPDGKHFIHYSEDLLGSISRMDRTSSMRILLFYDNIPGFQLLDNTLSPHGTLFDLNQEDFFYISSVCSSVNNIYWGFDRVNNELLRFNDQYRVIDRTGDMRTVLGFTLDPVQMMEYDNRLYLADEMEGIFVFDQFGTYLRTLPIEGVTSFDVEGGVLAYTDGKRVGCYTLDSYQDELVTLPESIQEVKGVDIGKRSIYIGDGHRIHKMMLDR